MREKSVLFRTGFGGWGLKKAKKGCKAVESENQKENLIKFLGVETGNHFSQY